MRKSLAAATIAASIVGGSAAALVMTPGVAGAQDDTGAVTEQDGENRRGERVEALATQLNMDADSVKEALRGGETIASLAETQSVDVQVIIDAMVDAANERIATALADGNLTQEEADEKAAMAEEKATAIVNGEANFGRRGHRGGKLGQGLSTAAEAIGVEVTDLREALQGDQSLADVAASEGVDVQTVIDAVIADREAHLATAVEEGKIDQARADEISAELEQRVTDLVNGDAEFQGRRGRGPGRDPGAGGAPADADIPAGLPA